MGAGLSVRARAFAHCEAIPEQFSKDGTGAAHSTTSAPDSHEEFNTQAVRTAQRRPWHILYFLPDPHGHGALRPTPAYGSSALSVPLLVASPVSDGAE